MWKYYFYRYTEKVKKKKKQKNRKKKSSKEKQLTIRKKYTCNLGKTGKTFHGLKS